MLREKADTIIYIVCPFVYGAKWQLYRSYRGILDINDCEEILKSVAVNRRRHLYRKKDEGKDCEAAQERVSGPQIKSWELRGAIKLLIEQLARKDSELKLYKECFAESISLLLGDS